MLLWRGRGPFRVSCVCKSVNSREIRVCGREAMWVCCCLDTWMRGCVDAWMLVLYSVCLWLCGCANKRAWSDGTVCNACGRHSTVYVNRSVRFSAHQSSPTEGVGEKREKKNACERMRQQQKETAPIDLKNKILRRSAQKKNWEMTWDLS